MVRVQIVTRPSVVMTGTSRYVDELHRGLRALGVEVSLKPPRPFPPAPVARLVRRAGVDLPTFFTSYPLRFQPNPADIYHIPAQTMATLLSCQRFPGPVVVTVLDIIPYLVRHDPELNTFGHVFDRWFYCLALRALHRAEAIIAISAYTKATLVDELKLPAERIHVTHLGVDHDRFHPLDIPPGFRVKYGLDENERYVLYVGSDDPRKNLRTLFRALARLKAQIGQVKLLKVGRAHFQAERQRLHALAKELGIQGDVRFLDDVADGELPLFYNAADVLALPSFYEGFGFPALEAMACGKPVVVSDRASLPELVGDAAPLVDPNDAQALADALQAELASAGRERQQACLARAAQFTWDKTARQTLAVYQSVARS